MLFAAPYATKVYGMEPDYRAFQELYHNVHANPHLEDKITVLQLCISDKAGVLKMHGQPGSSMSTLMEETEKQKKISGRTEWEVQCMTLEEFIAANRIDANKLVLKIDTEGAERDILRQLRPFIAKYKPSMLLSMHAFAYPDDNVTHAELQEIILSYKTVLFPNGRVRAGRGRLEGGKRVGLERAALEGGKRVRLGQLEGCARGRDDAPPLPQRCALIERSPPPPRHAPQPPPPARACYPPAGGRPQAVLRRGLVQAVCAAALGHGAQ